MTIQDMHYDFKKKLNKIDSQQNRNLLIPEIDWALNEALELFVKWIAKPRLRAGIGFEMSQRSIDDIRTLVVNSQCSTITSNLATLPVDYWHFLNGKVTMTKGACTTVGRFIPRQHDDMFEESPFDKSSFEWKEVNGHFVGDTIKLFTDGTFVNTQFCLSYIKKHPYMNYAAGFTGGTYTLPSGTVLSTPQDCLLPFHTHREIVDIAVLIASGEIQAADYEIKLQKLGNNMK